jgi:hypothetical protein
MYFLTDLHNITFSGKNQAFFYAKNRKNEKTRNQKKNIHKKYYILLCVYQRTRIEPLGVFHLPIQKRKMWGYSQV